MTNSTYASAPESAKALKHALQQKFPAVKFSVRLSRGTGYGMCHVSWTDGPSMRLVDEVVHRFEGEGFDGMTDSTYQKDGRLPDGRESGLRLINTSRNISAGFARKLAAQVAKFYGVSEPAIVAHPDTQRGWWLESDGLVADTREFWSTLIFRASSDRTQFAASAR